MENDSLNTITLIPSGVAFDAPSSVSLLESALKANIALSYSCNNGSCNTCEAEVIDGPQDLIGKTILTCQFKPEYELTIKVDHFPELESIKKITSPCKINDFHSPTNDIAVLSIRLPPKVKFDFLPGQYIDLKLQGVSRSYSLASLPNDDNVIELHLKNVLDGEMSSKIFEPVKLNQLMQLEGPKGTFFLRGNNQGAIVFLATGTGFAPVKAMVLQLIKESSTKPIYIYWGNRYKELFYDYLPETWQSELKNVTYFPCLSKHDSNWAGRDGYIQDWVLNDALSEGLFDLATAEIYACGSNGMIQDAKDKLVGAGLKRKHFHSDAFVAS